jgi:single-stranded DNA-binding protein
MEKASVMGCLNRVLLIGEMSKYGVTVKYAPSGTPCANFTLQLTESGQDGKPHTIYVECEVWGKHAEAVGELESGQLTLFEGKLAKRNRGEAWEMVVSGYDAIPVLTPQATLTGSAT